MTRAVKLFCALLGLLPESLLLLLLLLILPQLLSLESLLSLLLLLRLFLLLPLPRLLLALFDLFESILVGGLDHRLLLFFALLPLGCDPVLLLLDDAIALGLR